jgi:hypothetical protein
MKKKNFSQSGQALILIVFAAIGLFAFAALAIDGSRIFSNHRHSQNASDTAVLAAALLRVQDGIQPVTGVTWQEKALQRAADNGYSNGGQTEVDTFLCSDLPKNTADGYTMDCRGLPTGLDPSKKSQYIYVHIKSVIPLYFAPVIGRRTYTDNTDAVAHAGVPVPTTYGDGAGIWVQHDGCKSPGVGDPFFIGGSNQSQVLGSGVLVNSSCSGGAVVKSGTNSSLFTDKGICVNGTADSTTEAAEGTKITSPSGVDALREHCEPVDPDSIQMPPPPTCTGNARDALQQIGPHEFIAQPGNYNHQFPNINGGDTVYLTKGVYCLNDGLKVNANAAMTTDWDNDGVFEPSYEGVLFYLPGTDNTDNITFDGSASIHIHAMTSNSAIDEMLLNLLIYVNPDYSPTVTISGNNGSTFTGTILAPSAAITLQGSSDVGAGTVTIDSQIIGDTVALTGNNALTLIYNESNNATTLTTPDMSVIE